MFTPEALLEEYKVLVKNDPEEAEKYFKTLEDVYKMVRDYREAAPIEATEETAAEVDTAE
jgi:hypothetical protein